MTTEPKRHLAYRFHQGLSGIVANIGDTPVHEVAERLTASEKAFWGEDFPHRWSGITYKLVEGSPIDALAESARL